MFAIPEIPARAPIGPRRARGDRRTKRRLRELCDEVLASYRLARGEDVLTEQDRQEAERLLPRIAPEVARRG